MATISKNIFAFHTDPKQLVGYESREMVPTLLLDKIRSTLFGLRNSILAREMIQRHRDIFGKDLDVALRASELYKNSQGKRLWPVGGEVEMALLRSPKHRSDYLFFHIDSEVQKDPRYLDILGQLDPVFLAEHIGYFSKTYMIPKFKHDVLKIINRDIVAGVYYSVVSQRRNVDLEPVLLRMSTDKWHDILRNSNLSWSDISAWEYYLNALSPKAAARARSDAKAHGYV